jgi:stearoyl-CoA 9-desaturase NADPH oxidoreductase
VTAGVTDPSTLARLRLRAGRLARAAVTPHLPSDYIELFDPLWSTVELRGRIQEVRPETRDAVTLVIRPGRRWKRHQPGQYVRIGVDVDGVRQWRAYSLTSPVARQDGCISVTVKAIPHGIVSNYLVRRARPGLVLQLNQPTGDFVLPANRPGKVLFITGGSGITPVMGMLRNAVHELDDVVLVHSSPTPEDVIFAPELRRLASQGRIRLLEKHTDIDGMLETDELARLVPDLAERETWACGPNGLLDLLQECFENLGVADRLHTERFRPNVLSIGDGGSVTFTRSQIRVDADGTTPLLDVGEACGILMPAGCRMGICYGCVVSLRSGAVRDLRNGALTAATEGDGVLVQTCVSAPAGTCDIDL